MLEFKAHADKESSSLKYNFFIKVSFLKTALSKLLYLQEKDSSFSSETVQEG